jgi:acetyl-CoA carboxylase biotin carboxylase subunit
VTEQRTGLDLIAEQIKSAQGYPLELTQKEIHFSRHVMEFRINAENSQTGLPSPGTITHYHRPGGLGVRSDDYIYTGYTVPPNYDSMVSKIIVTADSREKCIKRAIRALNEIVVSGISTNIELHKHILQHEDFIKNRYSTNFLTKILE